MVRYYIDYKYNILLEIYKNKLLYFIFYTIFMSKPQNINPIIIIFLNLYNFLTRDNVPSTINF